MCDIVTKEMFQHEMMALFSEHCVKKRTGAKALITPDELDKVFFDRPSYEECMGKLSDLPFVRDVEQTADGCFRIDFDSDAFEDARADFIQI